MSAWLAYRFTTYANNKPFEGDFTVLGIFSSREKALERIKNHAKENGYSDEVFPKRKEGNILICKCSFECEIGILERTLDEDCEHEL